jgi:phosphatidate phosphatase PAH1
MNNVLGWLLGGNSAPSSAGAIDIVAVNRDIDRDSHKPRILCSPFHVKFSERCTTGEKRHVRVSVDGRTTDVYLRLGTMGEAYFVERVKEVSYEEYRARLLHDDNDDDLDQDHDQENVAKNGGKEQLGAELRSGVVVEQESASPRPQDRPIP